MLAQHLITKPVFDALFKDSKFTQANPVSRAMETVLGQLHEHNLAKESESLEKFYTSVERRAEGIKTAQGRQTLITELYDRFFRNAFPRLTQRLGIVYTPVEVVDFIIHSVNDVLKAQFGQTLGSKGVHILDPFTGTGTFITRLLQSGLIAPEELEHKYKHEIHANEIVLLAYYIAAVNIETVYHELAQGELSADAPYHPFTGILLTDTFQMYEQERDMVANLLPDNSERRTRQKALDIRVIMGNPPYSAGQGSANDNAANIAYPALDTAIRDSYAAHSSAANKNALYDSYIRAIRWASDRIGDAGVMAYVTNAGWVDGNATDGLRKCLAEEFSDLYVFHLRGNARTAGEQRRKERGNVFGEGTRTPVAVYVLVKNPNATEYGQILFHDIGDYLDQKQKLNIVRDFASIDGITAAKGWKRITPDVNHDWLDQVDPSFDKFMSIGSRDEASTVFSDYYNGIQTNRDPWAQNASIEKLEGNLTKLVAAYERDRTSLHQSGELPEKWEDLINSNTKLIKWTRGLKARLVRNTPLSFGSGQFVQTLYRPYSPQWVYRDKNLNEYVNKSDKLFPDEHHPNLTIITTGPTKNFSVVMSNQVSDVQTLFNGQCFPLYLYEEVGPENGLFATGEDLGTTLTRRAAITHAGFAHFQAAYPGQSISKEGLFYYIYGLLHSPDYRARFKNNLAKQLPRIPAVKSFTDFAAFRDAGRALGDLHVNFEAAEPYMVTFKEGTHDLIPEAQADPVKFYRVKHTNKWRWGGKGNDRDKTTVIYNENITMQNIPLEAYDYVVNGKPALEWVMERQVVKTDKASGIVNDANDYANETMGDPRYPLELFQRVITVSLETTKIVNGLPELKVD